MNLHKGTQWLLNFARLDSWLRCTELDSTGNSIISTYHLLRGCIGWGYHDDIDIVSSLHGVQIGVSHMSYEWDVRAIRADEWVPDTTLTAAAKAVLCQAWHIAKVSGSHQLNPAHVSTALVLVPNTTAYSMMVGAHQDDAYDRHVGLVRGAVRVFVNEGGLGSADQKTWGRIQRVVLRNLNPRP